MVASLEKGQLELVDGLTRLLAAKKVEKEVWWEDDVTGKLKLDNPIQRRRAEIQANLKRHDFTPAELNAGITELHNLMVQTYGKKKPGQTTDEGWTQTDTAKMLGLKSHASVGAALAITEAASVIPAIQSAKTTNEAIKMVRDFSKIEAQKELAKRASAKSTVEITDPKKFFGDKILLGDCLAGMKELPDRICSLFITDPPFGIGLDQIIKDRCEVLGNVQTGYSDNEDIILTLTENIITEMARVGKPACQVVMFCGVQFWHLLRDWFQHAGFNVFNKPLIWVKASKNPFKMPPGRTNNPDTHPASAYEAAIYAWRGNACLAKQGLPDVFVHPTLSGGDKFHIAQKPISLMEEIISRFYHPETNPLLIDPFAGSGSTLVAARRLGIKQYFGFELDPEFRERAVSYLINSWMAERDAKSDVEIKTGLVVDPEEFE